MIFSRDVMRQYWKKYSMLPLFFFALFLTCLFVQAVQAGSQKTSFLPLHVNSPSDAEKIAGRADEALRDALSDTNMHFVARGDTNALTGYTGPWPPQVSTLIKIAEQTKADNIAVGNLTVIGGQISIDIKLFDLLAPEKPTYYFQTTKSLDNIKDALQTIVADIRGYTERDFRVFSIAPEGNNRIDSGAILRKIQTKPGDAYDPAALRNDLKAIYQMGYFNDVQIDVSESQDGKAIIFRVIEKPVINAVLFEGISELKEEDVQAAANIKEHFILNPAKISVAEQAIQQLYKTKGFYNCTVKSKISYPDDKGAIVRFIINEGPEVYIKEITVEGNETFDDKELLDVIETGKKSFMSWLTDAGLLDMNKIRQDSQRIGTFYNNNGFLEVKIGDPIIEQDDEGLTLKFVVEEGPRFMVGTVDVSGDLIEDKSDILALLAIRNEKFLNGQVLRDDIMKLTDYYAESGYAFANIRPATQKAPSGNRIDVMYNISKGNLVYIDRITIKGNSRTRDNVIRRELRIAEGGVFDSKAIRKSTQALQRLSYFEEVNITPEPSLDPDRMNVTIEVKEKSTGTFSIGAGYSSVDKLIVMGQIAENNFLGRGDTLSFSANASTTSGRYNLAYTNPHLYDSNLSWGLDIFSTNREYDDYTKDSTGGGIRIGYPVFEEWRIFGNYSYVDTDLSDISADASYAITESADIHITSSIKLSLVRDTRNKQFLPSEGSRNVISVKYAGGPFGGDAQFTKAEGTTSWYFPLIWKTVFHFKAAAGQVFENESDKLPVYEKFYLGGLNSVRGFEYAKISPIDPITGDRIGGDKMWYTNVEIIFPLLEKQGLAGLVFYDSGRVYDGDEGWADVNEDTKHAAGVGISWLSPMGPLQVVWGYNLDPLIDEDDSVWDFSVGGTF